VVEIESISNLFNVTGTDSESWNQDFGKGHVVLSSRWGGTTSIVSDFFDSFLTVLDDPADVVFVQESTSLSSYAVSIVPKYSPTQGQAEALKGTLDGTSVPGSTNRYVVEDDQGLGTQVDFSVEESIPTEDRENDDISRYGWTGSLAHRVVKLEVDASGDSHDYENDILPRLKVLFGRDLVFADRWWDGTRLKFYDGDKWVG